MGKSEPSPETFPSVTELNSLVVDIDPSTMHINNEGVDGSLVKFGTVTHILEYGEEEKCASP